MQRATAKLRLLTAPIPKSPDPYKLRSLTLVLLSFSFVRIRISDVSTVNCGINTYNVIYSEIVPHYFSTVVER